ncbi:MAG TPA: biopolymer transporter ExbD [Pseudomonadales bacterium]
MKKSMRAKRMERNHKRYGKSAGLNLTALMDIFTILVFFLMVNSSDVQVLKNTDSIIMPLSVADQIPEETLLIQVSSEEILVGGIKVADVPAIRNDEEDIIAGLDKELRYQASRRPELSEEEMVLGRPVTIQGHNEIPYVILRKIMATCAQAEYRNISLAVSRLERPAGGQEGQ